MDSSLPTKFLDVDLKITEIYCHRKEVLVKFQGRYNTEDGFDYHILQHEIQQVSKVKDTVGIGEFCLVEDPDCGEWFRGRVALKKNHTYEVFLMDSGKILTVHDTHIASAVDELFQLPPRMVCGIFANILPNEEKWDPKALNYFSSLIDLQIKGHVQAILPHQTFLLDVPKITSDVVELKLGRLVDGDTFHLIVEMLTELPQEPLCKQMPDLLQQKYTRPDSVFCDARIQPDAQPILSSLQPVLSVGVIEKVKISVAVSPGKFYCHLMRHQVELDELTTSMSSYYESIRRENVPSCDNLGVLCAARQKDGQWHRGVIQQLLTDNKVRVWFMDFGSYEVVPSNCILKLQPEFVSVPMFSLPCALSCLSDEDETVRSNQLKEFKETLLRQSVVYVHIDLFNSSERLYYVTLHKHESAVNECLPQGNNVIPKHHPSEIAITGRDVAISGVKPAFAERVPRDTLQPGNCSEEKNTFLIDSPLTIPFKRAEIKIDSVCVAFVEYVLNPSNFWIHTNDYLDEFEKLMKNIADAYDSSQTCNKILENPEPGNLCCARYSKDMHFYRAVIREVVDNTNCIVYFLDFGNTETVPLFDVRILLPEFQELPALAICCSLANAFPIEDIWIKKETDYFKKIVFGQPLTLHVIAQQNNKYIVNVQCMNGSEHGDLLMFMVQAGYAEYWAVKQDLTLNVVRGFQIRHSKLKNKKNKWGKPPILKNKVEKPRNSGQNRKSLNVPPVMKESDVAFSQYQGVLFSKCESVSQKSNNLGPYKEYQFKPGTVIHVICCHSASPGDFRCQLQTKLPELNNLMEQIQLCYNTQTYQYESGQVACVVKHLKDGKWYRAAVLKHVSETEVDVVLVDYGSHERVLMKDLRAIIPDFLILECQAIRCCLNIVTESLIFDPHNWTSEACRDFEYFVSASDGPLTCTISALCLRSPNLLYNVVDLQTQFVSAQQFLLERGHAQFYTFEFARSLVPSFSLCTFYYSSFNMKVGNEEDVCITHIHNPTKFYCQLNRNADDIDKLLKKTAEISQMTRCSNQISTHNLCLAKYLEDGLFYRALSFPLGSSDFLPVYFVDFGNKQLVAKDELIRIPDFASEILFTPMQAIKCYLSDLKDTDIPVEISAWFEKNCLGRELKAVIVSKDSSGQLGVELYDNDLQISRKIKELLGHVRKGDGDPKGTNKCAEKSVGNKNKVHKVKLGAVKAKVKNEVVSSNRGPQNNNNSCYHGQVCAGYGKEIVDDLQEQCSSPVQHLIASEGTEMSQNVLQDQTCRGICGQLGSNSDDYLTPGFKELLAGNMAELLVKIVNPLGKERSDNYRQKYTSLPQRSIQPYSKTLAYMSSGTSPSNFSIYLAEDENIVVQLAEILNGNTLALDPATDVEFEEGDIVLAEYEADCCIYRAVVKGVTSEKLYQVEFIDYGNISTVTASKIYRMEEFFLNFPRLSIHCFLTAKCVVPDNIWSSDIAAYFVSKLNNQPIVCEFLQQHSQEWEVDVFIHGVSMSNELMQKKVSLDSQFMPILNLDKIAKRLPVTDTNADVQNQNVYEGFELMPFCKSPPKIAHQKIKPGQIEIVEICHISSDGNFYVKLIKDLQTLPNLHLMAAQEGGNSLLLMEDIKEGSECLTKSKETLQWYRSEVIKLFVDEDNMLVFLLDIGKYEIVSVHDTKMLSRKIRCIPRNAVLCKWVSIKSLSDLSFESVAEMIKCHEIKILFLRYLQGFIWEVDILVDGVLLLEHWKQCFSCKINLEKCNISGSVTDIDKTMSDLSFKLNSIPWIPFQNGRSYLGFVTSVTDPSNFCIQLEDSFKSLETLFKAISEVPDNLPAMPQELIVPGASCCIKIGSSDEWNRVEISEVSDLVIMLTLIDDGLSAAIPTSDIQKLKVIPEQLVNLPRLNYPCSLFGVSPTDGKNWSDEAKLKIHEFLGRQGLVFQLKQYHYRTKLEVDVFCEQNSAVDVLVASGCAAYSKMASSFGSVNCAGIHLLNSQIQCDPLQRCDQTNSVARITLLSEQEEEQQKSDLQFRYACDKISKWSSKRRSCKRRGWQEKCLHSNKRENEKPYDRSLLNQLYDKELGQSYSKGILSKALRKMHDLQLSIEFDRLKLHEERPSNEHSATKVKGGLD